MKDTVQASPGMVTEINSDANRMLKLWRSLLSGKGVKKHRLTLVSGAKAVSDVIGSSPGLLRHWIQSSRWKSDLPELHSPIPIYRLRHELFREIDQFGTDMPVLVVEVPEFRPVTDLNETVPAVLMVPFQDPANVGAVIRSAAAFGIRDIVLLTGAANPFHPKSIRASSAQVFRVICYEGPSIDDLHSSNLPIVALAADGAPIAGFDFPERFALLPGVEGPGLPANLPRVMKVSIPMEPDVESLNANVAASIALYEWRRRFNGR